jgi:4-amino-4-deoxy-L-arabinose transferase-like glycosyltransferase
MISKHRILRGTLSTLPHAATEPATPTERLVWAALIALTLYLCYFTHLDVIGFLGPDEPRYAWIARDMAESGDWITPRLYGKPWFEKPPLLYWGGAFFFKLFGEGHPEVATRLPSAICALLATLTLAWLAWRTYGRECACWLLVLLPTSAGMIGFSHAAATDMPFAAMLTVALVSAAVVFGLVPKDEDASILPHTPWGALLFLGVSLGLAVLAKGPAALFLAGGAVFFWGLLTRRWGDAFRLFHPASIIAFCLTALPWYIVCARRNPDFLRIFIIEHNFKRFLTPEFQHTRPIWFYLPILLIAFLPWLATALWSFSSGLLIRGRSPLTSLLLSWSVFCVVFFSISNSKLPGYILPAVPPIGLLLARGVQALGPTHKKSFQTSAVLGSSLFVVTALFFFEAGRLIAPHSHLNANAGTAYGLLALLFSLANLLFFLARWDRSSRLLMAGLAVVPILVGVFFAPYFVWSSFEHDPSGRTIGYVLKKWVGRPDELFLGPMSRGKRYGINFYLSREIPEWNPDHPRAGVLVLERGNCAQLVPAPFVCSGGSELLGNTGASIYSVALPDSLGHPSVGRQPQ